MKQRLGDWRFTAAALVIVVLHAALAWWAASGKSTTADEILHVTGGYFYNRHGDFRLHPENGVLPQRLHGLAPVLLGAAPPQLEGNIYWRTADTGVVAHQFFYESGNDHRPFLNLARGFNTVFTVATGLLVFAWTRRLFGNWAALFAVLLYGFDPNVLAHSALATSDAAATFFLLASVTAFWRQLGNPDWRTAIASGVVFGLACVAKFSAVVLIPVFVVLALCKIASEPGEARSRAVRFLPVSLGAHALVAIVIIWALFGFRYSGFSPDVPPADHYIVPWNGVLPNIGFHGTVVQFCRDWQLLPEPFLFGYSWVVQSAQTRAAFLAGEYSVSGWIEFFPLAFFWKTPLAELLALSITVFLLARRWVLGPKSIGADLSRVAPLVVLLVVYSALTLTSNLNIGHRHILPVYPVLLILAGGLLASAGTPPRSAIAAATALVALQATAAGRTAPHFLAYFNPVAGGPANGYRLLVDSSLDWGQDLPGLKQWLDENNAGADREPVFLSYFGSGDPRYHGINAVWLPFVNGFKQRHPWYELRGGIFCVSATTLQQVYSPHRGTWTADREQEYRILSELAPTLRLYFTDPGAAAELLEDTTAAQWEATWQRFDQMRFARLCGFLRQTEPAAMIGYSILVYRLSDAEVASAVIPQGSPTGRSH